MADKRRRNFPNRDEAKKLPVILKPEGDKEGRGGKSKPPETTEKPLSQPTIILRTRDGENRAVSPSQRSARGKKENESPAPLYHLAPKASTSENANALALPTAMVSPVSLIDDQYQMSDACLEFLTDQTDFTVIGCVGPQGVGKSTLMSHLAGSPPSQLINTIFKTETEDHQMVGSHCTSGIDFYITQDRMIFLDCQPMLSPSLLDLYIRQPQKIPSFVHGHFDPSLPVENIAKILSLQLTSFLMTVCHVVLYVQETLYNPSDVEFLHTAAMLKPATHTIADERLIEYFPHVMFVHTHCTAHEFSRPQVKKAQDWYKNTFNKSMIQLHSGLGIANGCVIPLLDPITLDQEPINLFLLPSLTEEESDDPPTYVDGHPGYEELVLKMRLQLKGIRTCPLSSNNLTEKNWFHYAAKVFETIKKHTFFKEYSRLLP